MSVTTSEQQYEILNENTGTYTGRHVKVALIDDGICLSHPIIKGVCGGVSIHVAIDGNIVFGKDYLNNQHASHGTICASAIIRKAPDIEIYSIRIFHEDLQADPRALIAAIKWAMENKMDLINLSLGTTSQTYFAELKDICKEACDCNIIIICADHHDGMISYPAAFDEVISVGQDDTYIEYDYGSRPEMRTEFVTSGKDDQLYWPYKGTSIATAKLSGVVAQLIEQYPSSNIGQIRKLLQSNAKSRNPYWLLEEEKIEIEEVCLCQDWSWLGKSALYSCNDEEMAAFAFYSDMLNFQMNTVVSPPFPGFDGKDLGEFLGIGETGVSMSKEFAYCSDVLETVIIGELNIMKRTLRKDLLPEVIMETIKHRKNVYSLTQLPKWLWKDLYEAAEKEGVRLSSSMPSNPKTIKLRNMPQYIDVPVVGVFGTGYFQYKLLVELAIHKGLFEQGYKLAHLSTHPLGILFGFDSYLSESWNQPQLYVPSEQIKCIEELMLKIYSLKQPDIFLIGTRGGVVPLVPYYTSNKSSQWLSDLYTLPTITSLLGSKPDAYILTVYYGEPISHIRDTIDALRIIGKGQTVAICFPAEIIDMDKAYYIDAPNVRLRRLSKESIEDYVLQLEDNFKIPAVCLNDEICMQRLIEAIVKYFAID